MILRNQKIQNNIGPTQLTTKGQKNSSPSNVRHITAPPKLAPFDLFLSSIKSKADPRGGYGSGEDAHHEQNRNVLLVQIGEKISEPVNHRAPHFLFTSARRNASGAAANSERHLGRSDNRTPRGERGGSIACTHLGTKLLLSFMPISSHNPVKLTSQENY